MAGVKRRLAPDCCCSHARVCRLRRRVLKRPVQRDTSNQREADREAFYGFIGGEEALLEGVAPPSALRLSVCPRRTSASVHTSFSPSLPVFSSSDFDDKQIKKGFNVQINWVNLRLQICHHFVAVETSLFPVQMEFPSTEERLSVCVKPVQLH